MPPDDVSDTGDFRGILINATGIKIRARPVVRSLVGVHAAQQKIVRIGQFVDLKRN